MARSKGGQNTDQESAEKAITYALGLWQKLTTYLEDGHIEIDNNKAENAIRPFVVGRKNFLFSGSPRGAHAGVAFYAFAETAKANGLESWEFLNHPFEKNPTTKSEQVIVALLPQNLSMDDLIKLGSILQLARCLL